MSDRKKEQHACRNGATFLHYLPQYECPACESVIPPQHVFGASFDAEDFRIRRMVRVYCKHCDEVFEAKIALSGGVWHVEDGPRRCTSSPERKKVMASVARLGGDVQLQAC